MALSPPNPSSAMLRACTPANSEMHTSTLIQAMVTSWTAKMDRVVEMVFNSQLPCSMDLLFPPWILTRAMEPCQGRLNRIPINARTPKRRPQHLAALGPFSYDFFAFFAGLNDSAVIVLPVTIPFTVTRSPAYLSRSEAFPFSV